MVLVTEGDRADGTLDGIVVDLDAAVIEEATECRPARKEVADSPGKGAVRRNAIQVLFQPDL